MDDEIERPSRQYPTSTAKMSKTPSWVMLGFVLGAIAAWSVMSQVQKDRRPSPAVKAVARTEEPRIEKPRDHQPLTTIDAVFEEWVKYAVWEYDSTEVALWDSRTNAFSDFYEVRRYANRYYYRPIPSLTRRLVTRELPAGCPLRFTETEEQYQEWRRYGITQQPRGDYRPLSAFGGEAKEPTKALPKPDVTPLPPPKFEAIAPFELPPVKAPEPGKK